MDITSSSMQKTTKNHIRRIVNSYVKQFPEEFELVRDAVASKRGMTMNDFATLDGTKHTRALYEISETLHTMLVMQLDEGEMIELKTIVGGRWFAKAFPVFALPAYI